jgi:Trk K+ transport system NAD-binding subunit
MARSSIRQFEAGRTVIVGYGTVGQTAGAALDDNGIEHTVVDRTDTDGVDVVGDATESATLTEAGIEDAQTVILALPDDTTTEFATLVVRELAPDTEIIARVEENGNISKTYRAGADYVLSLQRVTGRMAASYLLEDHDVLSVGQQVEIARTQAPKIAGRTIGDVDIRERTGCTVIAIRRDGAVDTDITPETEIRTGDELVIVGTDAGVREFEQLFT